MGEPRLDLVASVVRDIGRDVLVSGQHKTVDTKRDGSCVTDVDLNIQKQLEEFLTQAFPDIPLLGEEMPEQEREQILRSNNSRIWCLDPLDGTTNYTSGLPFYGISLALMQNQVPRLAVVYDPIRDECFTAQMGEGAWLNGERLSCSVERRTSRCIACVDFKRLARTLAEHLVAQPPYKSQRNLGACVLEWCWLAADRFQLYLHGGQHLWDYAAGCLILREAGGSAVTLEGVDIPVSSHYLNRKISVVAASHPTLLEDWWSWISDRAELYSLLMHK